MNALVVYLRRHHPPAADSDAELLGRYLAAGDEAAFAELVRRHGPLVWGACRRHLPDPTDAEDVFQATWLVLVRKARALASRPTVGPWLYRVAAHTARNLRRRNAHRLTRRRPLADVPAHSPALTCDLDDALLSLEMVSGSDRRGQTGPDMDRNGNDEGQGS
jgi:DNA-directed RNA polymerase specialized sigma24 family protein